MTGIGDEHPFIVACPRIDDLYIGVLSVLQLGSLAVPLPYNVQCCLVREADAPSIIWGLPSFHHRASTSLRSCPYRCRMRYLSYVFVLRLTAAV